MGGRTSCEIAPPPPNFAYFSLTFRMYDKIKLIDCDGETLALIQQLVAANWPEGILSEHMDNGSFEMQLRGAPFSKISGREQALVVKRLCCTLLLTLRSVGWQLIISSDLSRTTDLTTWFFHKTQVPLQRTLPLRAGIVCLSLSSFDKLQLINAPSFMHEQLRLCVGNLVHGHELCDTEYEITLVSYFWSAASFEEGITARQLLLDIFRMFDRCRYTFSGTVNLKGTADSVFFEQCEEDFVSGSMGYCMLSLNASDRIRLIDCPKVVVDTVLQCIQQYWTGGLEETREHDRCVELKLPGYPWRSFGEDAINSRYLITVIMQSLLIKGWAVLTALDISRRIDDKAVFVLRSCPPASAWHMCISPSDVDKIRLLNAPPEIVKLIKTLIHTTWPYGIQREKVHLMAYEWKLRGHPWESYGSTNDYALSRHLLTLVLDALTPFGWKVVCSADVSSNFIHKHGPDFPCDVHSWFLSRIGNVALTDNANVNTKVKRTPRGGSRRRAFAMSSQ